MAPTGYAPLPNPQPSQPDADRELNDAFESDGEEYDEHVHNESTPFIHSHPQSFQMDDSPTTALAGPATYDFERDYDHPPPGSPPGPSTSAFPNNFGNSNGLSGSTPVRPNFGRSSFFRRAMGTILPRYYASVPTTEPSSGGRTLGGGTDNDGVFANVMAKPTRARQILGENGEVHLVPEEVSADAPPTYREAQLDAVPQYWETTVHAPINTDPNADMIVEDLPTGSFILFVSNAFISFFFGFVGFLLTYLLHTSHASKYGSRAGLGMTLIQYGIVSKNNNIMDDDNMRGIYINTTTGMLEMGPPPGTVHNLGQNDTAVDITNELQATHDWASLVLMTMGWLLLLLSIAGYYRVKRWEMSIRAFTRASTAPTVPAPTTTTEVPSSARSTEGVYIFSADEVDVDDENSLHRGHETTPTEAERIEADLNRLIRAGFL